MTAATATPVTARKRTPPPPPPLFRPTPDAPTHIPILVGEQAQTDGAVRVRGHAGRAQRAAAVGVDDMEDCDSDACGLDFDDLDDE